MTTLLLDGHNLLYRAFTSLPQAITGSDDRPINAVYGMLATVVKLVRQFEASRVIAAFDEPDVPTFRHEVFPAYQGQRGPLGGDYADEFRRQTLIALSGMPSINIPALTVPRFEADDIMGTLATQIASEGNRAIIISTDRDLLQLVSPGIEVFAPGGTGIYARDADDVRERMGVNPAGITTFKALAGDASDNIPGVRGIGKGGAVKLVQRFESLESIYDHLGELSARQAGLLAAGRDEAFLFRRIVTVVTDLPLDVDLDTLPSPGIAPESTARTLLQVLEQG